MENSTINKRRSKVWNIHIDKLVYAPRDPFMKVEVRCPWSKCTTV